MCRLARTAAVLIPLALGGGLVRDLSGGQDFPAGGNGKIDSGGAPKGDPGSKGEKKEKGNPEDKAVVKFAEKAAKPIETDRDKWLKDLNKAFPGRVSAGLSEADFDQWFRLLAADGEWRREDAKVKKVADLFDRAAERLNLGDVPSMRRAEFLEYARRYLLPGFSPPWKPPADPLAGADKVFRDLDRDRSGYLEPAEWPDRLRALSARADRDRDGRINPDEYRLYFEGRVAVAVEFGPEPPLPRPETPQLPPGPIRPGRLPAALPAWFAERDADGDCQVALHEWRRAGVSLDEFLAMDLDGDGLLPPHEYLRFLRLPQSAFDLAENGDWVPVDPRAGR